MWASSKNPEIPTSAIGYVPIKRLTKRKVRVGFTRLLCLGNVIKNIIWVSKIWDSDWT